MKKIKLFVSLLSVMTLFLSGYFSASANAADADTYVGKEMHLSSDMMIVETKHWNPINNHRYWVFFARAKPYYSNYVNITLPTLAEYQQQPERFRTWKGDALSGSSRIIGVLSQGTRFRITDIAHKNGIPGYWVNIEIDEGQYRDQTMIYAEPRHLIPGLY